MPFTIRRSQDRGRTRWDWLDSRHTFSFGDYRDRAWMRYRSLRVLNDDVIAPGAGFGAHPHRDMEIITLVLRGAIEHKDSTGGGGILEAGDVQVMSAGSGIQHSEYNASRTEDARIIQTWIMPREAGLTPAYAQQRVGWGDGSWTRVAGWSRLDDNALPIQQDADVFVASPTKGTRLIHTLRSGRAAWLHVGEGAATLHAREAVELNEGDAAAIEGVERVEVESRADATRLILYDLA